MGADIETRVLKMFEIRLKREPEVSATTRELLLENQRKTDFGDDETLLERATRKESEE